MPQPADTYRIVNAPLYIGVLCTVLVLAGCKSPDYERLPQNTTSESSDPFFGKDSKKPASTTSSNERTKPVVGTLTSNPRNAGSPSPLPSVTPSSADLATFATPAPRESSSNSNQWAPSNPADAMTNLPPGFIGGSNNNSSTAVAVGPTKTTEELKILLEKRGALDVKVRQEGLDWICSCDIPSGTKMKHHRITAKNEVDGLQALLQELR